MCLQGLLLVAGRPALSGVLTPAHSGLLLIFVNMLDQKHMRALGASYVSFPLADRQAMSVFIYF